jgi:uncharacterized protein
VDDWFGSAATQTRTDNLEPLDREACLLLLTGVDVGRIAWADGEDVMVFPLNFALDGEDIVMRTSSEVICAEVAGTHRLTFQADDFEPAFRTGWTVLASGSAVEVTDPAELEHLTTLVQPWRSEDDLRLLRLRVHAMTGRRLRTRPGTIETFRIEA